MIEIGINKINKNYGYKNILTDVSFEVSTGDRISIIGRNGAGKTTLFKIIKGEEQADSGSVSIRKGALLGYLEQIPSLFDADKTAMDVLKDSFAELYALEKRLKALEIEMSNNPDSFENVMNEYSRLQNIYITKGGYETEEKLNRITQGFNIENLLDKEFNILSGGQKTIIKLAATLLREPDILLLDEPTNHLDVHTLNWFEDFLKKYKGTVFMISHDRYFLDKTTTKTIILEKGRAELFKGNYSFSQKEKERLLLLEFEDYKNQQKKIEAMQKAIKRYRDWGARADNEDFFKKAKMLERRLEKMEVLERPELQKKAIPLSFEGSRTGKDVLVLENLSLSFDEKRIFENINFSLYEKEKVCLAGRNGSGKTSLIKVLLNDIKDFGGNVKINPSAKIGYIPQEIRFSDPRKNVLETFRYEFPSLEFDARRILAKYFFCGDNVYKSVDSLSGGEKVLLKLAVLIQQEVNFLILDEPTNHIDIETREVLENALLEYKNTLLFVSHDRYFTEKIATKVFVLDKE